VKNKKVLYISNVNINGRFLPGVVNKIIGQEQAFRNKGYEIDLLFPNDEGNVVIKKHHGEILTFSGARKFYSNSNFFAKAWHHYKSTQFGSINFSDSFQTIAKANYNAIYLRFFLPGKDLVRFIKKIRKSCPSLKILLEYPTLHIKDLFQSSIVRKVSYAMNSKKIRQMNELCDYFITLTKDKTLFGKPAIFMSNGIDINAFKVNPLPPYDQCLTIIGVASDIAFYHGFDKVVQGLANYKRDTGKNNVVLRIVSNPISKNFGDLKRLVDRLDVADMVIFESTKSKDQLAVEYAKAHLGMGTLALHRINLQDNYSLKHREYAISGLPFIMSLGDDFFEDSPFVYTVERNEDPLDIKKIISFYESIRTKFPEYPFTFRKSIEKSVTWDEQMKNVFQVIDQL
jgi:hypothetical protein